ncbi:MAG: hypothetical protein KGZ88_11670 [Methylomicrobium sp.]|nr:hypothetical protein [Methylomicrobium sp.]
MSLLSELRDAIKKGKCPPIFKPADLEKAGIKDEGRNLANYDKKNHGTDHENALVSRKIGNDVYYTFDEAVLAKLAPRNALECDENGDGVRLYLDQ